MDTSCCNKSWFLTGCNISVEGMLYITEVFTAEKFKYALAWDGHHTLEKKKTILDLFPSYNRASKLYLLIKDKS